MLDIAYIRQNDELVRAAIRNKRFDFDLDELLSVDKQRRELITLLDEKRARKNQIAGLTSKASKEERPKLIDEGKEVKLATLGPGDVFGEMALLDEFPRSASARAVEPTTALGIQRWHFRGILESHPQIALALLPILTRRIRNAEAQHAEVTARH